MIEVLREKIISDLQEFKRFTINAIDNDIKRIDNAKDRIEMLIILADSTATMQKYMEQKTRKHGSTRNNQIPDGE